MLTYNPHNLTIDFADGWHVNGQRLEVLRSDDMLDKGCSRNVYQSEDFVLKVDGQGCGRQADRDLECWLSVSQSPDRECFAELLACLKIHGRKVVVQRKYKLVSQKLDNANRELLARLEETWLLADVSADDFLCGNYGVTADGRLVIYDYQVID